MPKLLIIYGTRPELIKLAPLILKIREAGSFAFKVINTGQHSEMLIELENLFGIIPDYQLNLMRSSYNLNMLLANTVSSVDLIMDSEKPDLVVVQGDTTTVMAAGIACFYRNIALAHVEAGLRSKDLSQPYPEEFNRRVVSIVARYNFAPTRIAAANLSEEGIPENRIFITGNTIVDSLQWILSRYPSPQQVNAKSRTILVTAHRRENYGEGIINICKAVKHITHADPSIRFIWPVHPNPNVSDIVYRELNNMANVQLTPPLNYMELLHRVANAWLIWTDSGGIQEEAPSLRKPVFILRKVTERPEVISSGFGMLVGTETDKIITSTNQLIHDQSLYNKMISGENPFGDGKASDKIIQILAGINS